MDTIDEFVIMAESKGFVLNDTEEAKDAKRIFDIGPRYHFGGVKSIYEKHEAHAFFDIKSLEQGGFAVRYYAVTNSLRNRDMIIDGNFKNGPRNYEAEIILQIIESIDSKPNIISPL